jgi:hypothetical protein
MASEVVRRGRLEIDAKVKGQEELKKLPTVMEQLEDKLGKAGRQMLLANLATEALTRGIGLLKDAIGTTLKLGLDWEDWIGKNTEAVDGMSKAVAGMIDKLELSHTVSKLQIGDFKATQSQLEAVSKAAVEFARINRVDLAEALKTVTDAIVAGSGDALKKLGINLDLAGSAAEKTQAALELIQKRFGGVAIEAKNTNEQLATMKSRLTDATAETTAAILQTDLFRTAIGNLTLAFETLAQFLNRDKSLAGVQAQIVQLRKDIAKVSAEPDFLPMFKRERLEKLNKELERLLQLRRGLVAQAEAAKAREAIIGVEQRAQLITAKARDIELERKRGVKQTAPAGPGIDVEAMRGMPAGELEADAARMRGEQMIDQQIRAADVTAKLNAEMKNQNELVDRLAQRMGETAAVMKNANADMGQMAIGGLAQMASGMWDVVDAAIAGEMSIGKAVATMLKSVMMGLAKEATVKAVFQIAEGLASWAIPPKAAAHFAAAAKYGTVAVMAGTAGLAMGAIGRGAGGGAREARDATRGGGGATSRPTVGRDREKEAQAFAPVINVYLDQDNPASGLHWRKQIKALGRAA